MTPALVLALLASCAQSVAPETMLALVSAESGYDEVAIHDDTAARSFHPMNLTDAIGQAHALLATGHVIGIGLGQISSRNLAWLGLTLDQAFDPCANLGASARVLTENYANAAQTAGEGQAALRIALSKYNTGSAERGVTNGYVARVIAERSKQAGAYVPALDPASTPAAGKRPDETPAARWDVFGDLSSSDGDDRAGQADGVISARNDLDGANPPISDDRRQGAGRAPGGEGR